MNYPSIKEYKEAILFAEDNFEQLKNLRPVLEDDGSPVMTSGNFAVVFKMKDEQTGKIYAVKCFLREQEGRAEAYRQIAEELEYVSSTFLTPIKYLDKELFVDTNASDDTEFPVLLMDWVEGDTLDKYIRKHLDDQYELSLLAYQFSRLAMWLMPQPFAHGDLKPDNILVKSDGTLVLVDYDGMYVPAMKGQKARELGSPDFRHPSRTETDFDEHIDDFSLASILLSLKAISLQPSLLEEYGAQDRLIFSEKDYRNLSGSKVMDALKLLMQDAELASLYSLFILAHSQNNLSQISFRLFNLSRPEKPQYEEENLSTKVTEEDLTNAWTDEYGVMYSKDGKRLLKATKNLKNYNIRKGTIVICNEAFRYDEVYDISFGNNDEDRKTITISSVFQCKELESVTIPNSTIKIGSNAFQGCKYLRSINIPNSVKEIGDYALSGCQNLSSISIPNSLFKIGNFAFGSCAKIKSVIIPSSVSEIGENPFAGCINLTHIIVDKGNNVFDSRNNCEAIVETKTNVLIVGCCTSQIPTDISGIGNSAFYNCKKIESITIPNRVSSIGENSFYGCSGLKKIEIRRGITKIGQSAFEECVNLSSIDLPEGLTTMGAGTFEGCKKLTSAFIPKSLRILYAKGTTETYEYDYHTPKSWNKSDDDTISFSDVIEIVGLDVFIGCDKIKSIFVPFGTKAQFEEFFPLHKDNLVELCEAENLSTEVSDEDLANAWKDEYGAEYSMDRKRLLRAPKGLSKYKIKDEVVVICDYAFAEMYKFLSSFKNSNPNYKGISTVTFPNGVRKIGKLAFFGCSNLKTIYIPIGFKQKYEILLPHYKEKFVEQKIEKEQNSDYKDKLVVHNNGWKEKGRRSFSLDEIAAVARAEVVPSQYGNSVCFFMNTGGQTYIPLSQYSTLTIGDTIDLRTAKLITLCREGDDDIYRVLE